MTDFGYCGKSYFMKENIENNIHSLILLFFKNVRYQDPVVVQTSIIINYTDTYDIVISYVTRIT